MGYHFLTTRLTSLWKLSGRLDCVDLSKDFFLIRFSLQSDYGRVLKDGPWFVGGHYLSIRNWEANFRPSTANVSTITVGVRLPELPIEYYDISILRDIGKALGPVLRVDTHTTAETRGRFARIYVQINLDKPLIKLLKIGGINQTVQYEGLNSMCFSCGRAGHKVDGCPYTSRAPEEASEKQAGEDNIRQKDSNTPSEDSYGPWVLVSRKRQSLQRTKKDMPYPSPSGPDTISKERPIA
ncbi:uncharacterized protein At4g02000 [Quercus suber]|uniref:CCHC-type domain-containing protein n=1 Tax=Quercus suber TaxID=58331 RepID=A0AAW0LFC0_QUESU|nr:uncharacterized protein At4g02000-like [Quercus suber]POE76760.1 uncharacterized protein CFP56_64417 [Quercus suber]